MKFLIWKLKNMKKKRRKKNLKKKIKVKEDKIENNPIL